MAVMVGLRYGVPMDLPGKPRTSMPTQGLVLDYQIAADNQMLGDDQLMVVFLDRLVRETLARQTSASPPASPTAP
jgi:hypothetical protein